MSSKFITLIQSQFMVTEWLTHLSATLQVIGSCPGDIPEVNFLESIQSPGQDLNGLCDTKGIDRDLQCQR